MQKIINILFIITTIWSVTSQELINDSTNYIQNKTALQGFYDKINSEQSATILHIGDSHIQANFLTGHLRELLQEKYGKSGRGIVFPLRLTKTNGHLDIRFSSNITWDATKIIDRKNTNVGIAGVTISTTKPQFYIQLKNKDGLEISRVKIIGQGLEKLKFGFANKKITPPKQQYASTTYRVKQGDYLGKVARKFHTSVKNIKIWNGLKNDRIDINQKLKIRKGGVTYKPVKLNIQDFNLVEPIMKSDTEVTIDIFNKFEDLYIISNEDSQKSFTKIDGIFLENYNKGITYHSVGINGAKYTDYNKSDLFFKQLNHTNPDLIILSLGTNEAFYNTENAETFRKNVGTFLEKLKEETSCRAILLTTPPSSLIRKKQANPKLQAFTDVLIDVANQENFAVWNLFDITGKEQGIKKWFVRGLAFKDRIHYTKKGYKLQADMLFEAMINK